jgi:hypothetical protein
MKLGDRLWFQIVERGWRHFQQWGFAIAAVAYGFRPVFDFSFDVETFAILAAAGGVGFVTRGIEKVGTVAFERKDP